MNNSIVEKLYESYLALSQAITFTSIHELLEAKRYIVDELRKAKLKRLETLKEYKEVLLTPMNYALSPIEETNLKLSLYSVENEIAWLVGQVIVED
jgi:hypothetical protein